MWDKLNFEDNFCFSLVSDNLLKFDKSGISVTNLKENKHKSNWKY